jgi:hypothetical protein
MPLWRDTTSSQAQADLNALLSPDLSSDLRAAGSSISDLWELVNGTRQSKAAIPVLIDWLHNVERRVPGPGQATVREGLASMIQALDGSGY